jgi:hypothetical protein
MINGDNISILSACVVCKGKMIKPPSKNTPKRNNNYIWWPYFRVRSNYILSFLRVLVVVDFDLKFTCVLASWEGSTYDARIMANSLSRPDGLKIIDGKFYLGDVGYACWYGILPLSRKTRYHLNEFSAGA